MNGSINHPFIFSIGVNHRSSPLVVRERLSVGDAELPAVLDRFKGILDECMILSTCNRTEIYCVADPARFDKELVKKTIIDFKNAGDVTKSEHFFEYATCGAANHLFKVATSIDSMIVGDVQIMHQLKESFRIAQHNKSTGKLLNMLCQKALHTGKRVRHETTLYEGAFSVSFASVELAMKIFGSLEDKTVMVIGAGETAELTAKNLIRKDVKKIIVTNRTRANAEAMLEGLNRDHRFESEIVDFDNFKSKIPETDIIISSTGAKDYILGYKDMKELISRRMDLPMLIIDIAIPRDIDPKIDKLDNVFLKNIDDLEDIVNSDYEKRMKIIPDVKEIINQELLEFLVWYYSIPFLPAIQHILKNSANGMAAKHRIIRLRENLAENISTVHRALIENEDSFTADEINSHNRLMEKLHEIQNDVLNHGEIIEN
ncbi:MAG: glutamyl-tRNA reductase [Bacteroidetes bacterium]|nr:glutamyl-tRNA reductase [Bacteroidota bacterium]